MRKVGFGRERGRHLVENALCIDLRLLMRRGWITQGKKGGGKLRFSSADSDNIWIDISYDLQDVDEGYLRLRYNLGSAEIEPLTKVDQLIILAFTEPNFGGRRWWMVCPYSGRRAAKLYLPPGGDCFASRQEWPLTYRSQKESELGRAFSRLFHVQRKLGCDEQWGAKPMRPKGMWRKTFENLLDEYIELDVLCETILDRWIATIKRMYN